MPNPRARLNVCLKSPDVVIFDQKLCRKFCIKVLKCVFPGVYLDFFLFSPSLQCYSPYLHMILCYFILSFLSFLCLHHFFLSVFISHSPFSSHWMSSCSYSISVLPFSLLSLFLSCVWDFFLLTPSKHNGSHSCFLIIWLVVRILVSSCPCQLKQKGGTSGLIHFSSKHKHSLTAFQGSRAGSFWLLLLSISVSKPSLALEIFWVFLLSDATKHRANKFYMAK